MMMMMMMITIMVKMIPAHGGGETWTLTTSLHKAIHALFRLFTQATPTATPRPCLKVWHAADWPHHESVHKKPSAGGVAWSDSACERVLLWDWSISPEHVEAFWSAVVSQKGHKRAVLNSNMGVSQLFGFMDTNTAVQDSWHEKEGEKSFPCLSYNVVTF